jgi:hypothetical protein
MKGSKRDTKEEHRNEWVCMKNMKTSAMNALIFAYFFGQGQSDA